MFSAKQPLALQLAAAAPLPAGFAEALRVGSRWGEEVRKWFGMVPPYQSGVPPYPTLPIHLYLSQDFPQALGHIEKSSLQLSRASRKNEPENGRLRLIYNYEP